MAKKMQTFKLDPELLSDLAMLAKLKKESFNGFVERELRCCVVREKSRLRRMADIMNRIKVSK